MLKLQTLECSVPHHIISGHHSQLQLDGSWTDLTFVKGQCPSRKILACR